MSALRRIAGCALLLIVGCSLLAAATLRIEDFAVSVALEDSGELRVTERLTVQFLTPHHGIERFIQVSGRTPWGERVKITLQLDEVQLDERAVPFTDRTVGSNRTLRIGDPDRTITGMHQYTIRYRVGRALLFSDNTISLYWNVTGNGWDIPIAQASASVLLPETVDPTAVSSVSYVGYYGSEDRQSMGTITQNGELLFETELLYPGEGLTILVSIPRDLLDIAPPTVWQRIAWFLDANKYAALPLLTLVGMVVLWARLGRDPRKRVIAPAFEPSRDMHPGSVGILIDDRFDLRDVTAMLVGLAVKGHLQIQELEAGGYVLVRRQAPEDSLSPAEKSVYKAIFPSSETDKRTLTSLEQEFYQSLPTIKSRLFSELIKAGYYPSNPERTRRFYVSIGLFALPLAVWAAVQSMAYLGASIALSGLVVLAFARFMPRKTTLGVRKLEEILGLSEYIRRAEVERIEFHNAPEKGPELFEKLLPYAIALNLTAVWTRQFEGLLKSSPEWYVGSSRTPTFNAFLFSHSLSTMTRSMQQTFVSAPRSSGRSAWSGRGFSGGGFSGGGFSGGGFGGGGGRGW